MSLSSLLPTPTNAIWDREDERRLVARGAPKIGALVSAKIAAPPYGQRKDWVPHTDADFGDGGAFPEIHVAQYPLGGFPFVLIPLSLCLQTMLSRFFVGNGVLVREITISFIYVGDCTARRLQFPPY